MKGCKSSSKSAQDDLVYHAETCELIPEWESACSTCGDKARTYHKKQCVRICRETADGGTISDIYESLIDDNGTFPVDGSRMAEPTWVLRNLCDSLTPPPIVKGTDVTKSVNPVTGQVTYTIGGSDCANSAELVGG